MRQPFVHLLFLAACAVSAQTVAPAPGNQTLSLADALAMAQDKYPAIKASLEQQAAAQHQIGVAKTAYLPRLDMLWQTNRATDNNRTGCFCPKASCRPFPGLSRLTPLAKAHGAAPVARSSIGDLSISSHAQHRSMSRGTARLQP